MKLTVLLDDVVVSETEVELSVGLLAPDKGVSFGFSEQGMTVKFPQTQVDRAARLEAVRNERLAKLHKTERTANNFDDVVAKFNAAPPTRKSEEPSVDPRGHAWAERYRARSAASKCLECGAGWSTNKRKQLCSQ